MPCSGFNPLAYRGQGVFLFAVPKKMFAKPGDAPKDEWFDGTTDGVLKSGQLASPVRSVAETVPWAPPSAAALPRASDWTEP